MRGPVSHLHAAAAFVARDRCLRLSKAINTKYEITFGRVRDSFGLSGVGVKSKKFSEALRIELAYQRDASPHPVARGVIIRHKRHVQRHDEVRRVAGR